jgi:hypothetical protein
MTVSLVFNDLSSDPVAPNIETARTFLEQFSHVLTDARIRGRRVLVAPPYFLQLQVGPGYSVGRWLGEYRDHDRRVRIKYLLDKSVDYTECFAGDQNEPEEVEYKFSGQLAQGLSVAHSIDGLALSFCSDEKWNTASLGLEKSWIINNDVETCNLSVLHACRAAHLDAHEGWLKRKEPPPPLNGQQLWDQRGFLFPRLDFCHSVEHQLTSLGGNQPRFKAVLRGLSDLQKYCNNWSTPNFDIRGLANASGESQPTMQMYSEERTFLCPDGEHRVFEWHLKRWDTRIHFFDFPASKRILVGYAGDHLRISSQ